MEPYRTRCRDLNVFRHYVLDARDVKEVVFVIIREITLHLSRIHSAVRLSDINRGNSKSGENITRHLAQGQTGAKRHSNNRHDTRERSAECGLQKSHNPAL